MNAPRCTLNYSTRQFDELQIPEQKEVEMTKHEKNESTFGGVISCGGRTDGVTFCRFQKQTQKTKKKSNHIRLWSLDRQKNQSQENLI